MFIKQFSQLTFINDNFTFVKKQCIYYMNPLDKLLVKNGLMKLQKP